MKNSMSLPAVAWMVLLCAALVALAVDLLIGPADLSPAEVARALLGSGDRTAVTIVRDLRAPRAALAFMVGGSLALTGCVLQALVRNPLAEPYLLGLSSGAGLGAVVVIAGGIGGFWSVPLGATIGSVLAIAIVYRMALVAGDVLDTRVLLFAGVVVSAFATAIVGAVLALATAAELRNALLWMLGGFDRASWPLVALFAAYAVLPVAMIGRMRQQLDLMSLGEEPAMFLGVEVERSKRILYLLASVLTAASVAVAGIIGFVGLVVPHAARLLWGHVHRMLLPASFLLGGTLMVLADAVARTVFAPVELPVGSVTALLGAPVFAMLLRRWMN